MRQRTWPSERTDRSISSLDRPRQTRHPTLPLEDHNYGISSAVSSEEPLRASRLGDGAPVDDCEPALSLTSSREEPAMGEGGVTFEPIPPPTGYPPLDFRPAILKPFATITICCIYIGLGAGLGILAYSSNSKVAYPINRDTYYFGIRYGPGILAALSTFLFKATVQEFLRMLPYFNMADSNGGSGAHYTVLSRYWPLLTGSNSRGTTTTSWLIVFSAFLLAYKALLLEVVSKGTTWEVYILTLVAIPLVVYYFILAVYMLVLTYWMWNRSTGLRSNWDPQSLADIISLFAWLDIGFDDEKQFQQDLVFPTIPLRFHYSNYRLGYWTKRTASESQIIYGIMPTTGLPGGVPQKFLSGQQRTEARVEAQMLNRGFHQYLFTPWAHPVYWISTAILLLWIILFCLLFSKGYIPHDLALLDDWSIHRLDRLPNGTLPNGVANITIVPVQNKYRIIGDESSPRLRRVGELDARVPLDGTQAIGTMGLEYTIPVPHILGLREKYEIPPPIVAKGACVLLNLYLTGGEEVLLVTNESGRSWPFVDEAGPADENDTNDDTGDDIDPLSIDGPTVTMSVSRNRIAETGTVVQFLTRLRHEQREIEKHSHASIDLILKALETPTAASPASQSKADGQIVRNTLNRQIFDWLPDLSSAQAANPAAYQDHQQKRVASNTSSVGANPHDVQAAEKPIGPQPSIEMLEVLSRTDLGFVWYPSLVEGEKLMKLNTTWDDAQLHASESSKAMKQFLRAARWLSQPKNWERPARECDFETEDAVIEDVGLEKCYRR